MEKYIINGGTRLSGELRVHGAKNSSLPILAASILSDSPNTVIHNCPKLTDIDNSIKILHHLGCKTKIEGNDITVDSSTMNKFDIPAALTSCMRSSIIFLGAILAKTGKAILSPPGGCKIGLRPIDLHISSLKKLGMSMTCKGDELYCECRDGLYGAKIQLTFPSVGATENIMLAAATACGDTIIENAAREPEISDLAAFLNKMGAKIYGAGERRIVIEGVKSLTFTEHTVIPDRIVASTFMAAAAVTAGDVLLRDIIPLHLMPVVPLFEEMGCGVTVKGSEIYLKAPKRLNALSSVINTMPYPGFPTDSQALLMAMACLADGESMFCENIFENRYRHAGELAKLGADIRIKDKMALVRGVNELYGAKMNAEDLRGGAALIVAALAAKGESEISGLCYIDRGYEELQKSLLALGADVKRGKYDEQEENSAK